MRSLALFLQIFLFIHLAKAQINPPVERIRIPDTKISFDLALLPGGPFMMGSPETESGRDETEGPRREIQLDSFWIGVYEVTYDDFAHFQFRQFDGDSTFAREESFKADAVARPSPPYYDFTYGRGKTGGFPASTMTQQAALRYCQWLSDKTGYLYRLPTEAEWEYACRAGTSTAWFFGEEASKLGEYAWFYDNSAGSYQKVGAKKPNPWGLYDMYGNVAEWTLDFYRSDYFSALNDSTLTTGKSMSKERGLLSNPWIAPAKKHSRTVKGGSFEDFSQDCRSAKRRKSDPKWQAKDPQIPKSKWWNPESWFVGFRVVRETRPRTKAERDAFFEKAIKD